MYRDAGYGGNWQPSPNNNARRLDPYTRSCAVLGCFFATGFVLIIIVVLSLIPVYISRGTTPQRTTLQVSKVSLNGYTLTLRSPSDSFNVEAILSQAKNIQALQSALTASIQSDSLLAGSIVEVTKTSTSSKRRRRLTSDLLHLSVDLNVTGVKPCTLAACLNQYQLRLINFMSGKNRQLSNVRFEQPNTGDMTSSSLSATVMWLNYQMPDTVKSSVSFTTVDPKAIALILDGLIAFDKSQNRPSTDTLITATRSTWG